MRTTSPLSPVHADVLSHLPLLLVRALDTPETEALLTELVAAGWRPGQLRHRVGAQPSRGSVEGDAAGVLELLRGLREATPPDVVHAAEREQQRLQREHEAAQAEPPASPAVRAAALAEIRSGLKGAPRRPREREPRLRPACSLCAGEGRYFVTRDVHLCGRCVDVMASGEARLDRTG